MEIIALDKTNEQLWDSFCMESDDAWFWHTSGWMNYTFNYRPDFKPLQMSFFVKEDNKLVALCILILEERDGSKEFTFGGFAAPAPVLSNTVSSKTQKKIQDCIFEYIDQKAGEYGVQKALFRFSPLAPGFIGAKGPFSNYLTKYGYLETNFDTQILNLSPSLEELKCNVRKGHKYDITRTSRVLDFHIYDAATITREAYDLYCKLHHKDAGRVTRPPITFDLMYDWIRQGNAVLAGASLKGKNQFVGFAYLYTYKNGVYYGSACSDPDMGEMPIAHFILWESIKHLKDKNYLYFELGWQFYGSTLHYNASEKDCTIARFKRGFGGYQVPQLIGEKYYDSELFEKEYADRIANYKRYLSSSSNAGEK